MKQHKNRINSFKISDLKFYQLNLDSKALRLAQAILLRRLLGYCHFVYNYFLL